ncbi:SDR family NAD(P)-dependent oxidoreductase [Natrinema soli]|uniref:SDR family NAD(P)-dependent oxidoreductase n=1 Tax=Natrinema soli TaxID=1930624 RepID=A0ABD5SWL3_9EURY|nr:SDR family NAD(P)-dependent oxidoreductase [Natrinema soli]
MTGAHGVADANTDADAEGAAHPIQVDVTDRAEIDAMREAVLETFGPIDILVSNAGITSDCPLTRMSPMTGPA